MPTDPSASAPRLHRDLRRLMADALAAGHRAYCSLDGDLIVEGLEPCPNDSQHLDPYGTLIISGTPGSWSVVSEQGRVLSTHTTIEGVRRAVDYLLWLPPLCPSSHELRRTWTRKTMAHVFGTKGKPGCQVCWAVLQTF